MSIEADFACMQFILCVGHKTAEDFYGNAV